MKKFYSNQIGVLTTGCQAKGVGVEFDNLGKKKTYYVKTEKFFDKNSNSAKLHFGNTLDNDTNMILYECLTSRIYQKLGINTVSYHFGEVVNSNNYLVSIPAVYSESFTRDDENQFPLTEVYKFFKFNEELEDTGNLSAIVRGNNLDYGSKSRQNYNQPYTYVDENIKFLQDFFDKNQTIYSGGININYVKIKTQLINQLIGDLLCYNGDRHSGNVVFVSKVQNGPNGRSCDIRLAPAFDFGYAFFAERSQNELKNLIEANTIPYLMDHKLMYCMSLTHYNNYSGHNDFCLVRDYIKLLKNKQNITHEEREVLNIVENVKKVNIKECFRELFIEELNGTNKLMSLDELIFLYNQQMNKNIDITTIENVEELFNYSRNLLLDENPTHNGNYTNLLQQVGFVGSADLIQQQYSQKVSKTPFKNTKNLESAMGDDEG